jgi:hypothetical protein
MLIRKGVAKRNELITGGLSRGGFIDPVMEMDLHFPPARVTMIGELIYKLAVVLFGGVEIGVGKGTAVVIAECLEVPGIFLAPGIEALLLNFSWGEASV